MGLHVYNRLEFVKNLCFFVFGNVGDFFQIIALPRSDSGVVEVSRR